MLRRRPLAGIPQGLRGEQRLQCGGARAGHGDVDLDDGPQIDQDALLEGVDGEGVGVDGVQAHHGDDGCEGADAEDADEGDLFFARAVDVDEGFDREGEDDDVGYDVEAGGDCGRRWLVGVIEGVGVGGGVGDSGACFGPKGWEGYSGGLQ